MKPWRWIEVDLSALRHNVRAVRRRLGPRAPFTAVVKADGYGHGAEAASRAFLAAGADELAVTYLEEALPLRRAGLRAPILLMGPLDPGDAALAVKNNLTVMVDNLPLARALGRRAGKRPVPVHLLSYYRKKFGFQPGDFPHAERYYSRCLSLPLYPGLSRAQQTRVMDGVDRFFR